MRTVLLFQFRKGQIHAGAHTQQVSSMPGGGSLTSDDMGGYYDGDKGDDDNQSITTGGCINLSTFQLQAFQLKADSEYNNLKLFAFTLLGKDGKNITWLFAFHSPILNQLLEEAHYFTKRWGVPSCHHSCWFKRINNYLEHAKETAGYLESHEQKACKENGCIKCTDWLSSAQCNIHENTDNFPEQIMPDAWNHPNAFEFIQLPLHQLAIYSSDFPERGIIYSE